MLSFNFILDYLKNILNYYNSVGNSLPNWYDANYAYSGLHSIIHPPPIEVDIWGTIVIPIFQLNRYDAECEFCFDNYAEYVCQFYKPCKSDFSTQSYQGKMIVCECCDFRDGDGGQCKESTVKDNLNEKRAKIIDSRVNCDDKETIIKIQAGWYGKGYRKNFRRKRKT